MNTAASSSETVAGIIANLNTRLGMTGKTLETNAMLFEKFGRATGTDAAAGVNTVANLLFAFNKDASAIPSVLDALTVAAQQCDASVLTLGEATSDCAFYARQYGMSIDETVAMLAAFESKGVDSNIIARAMRKSYEDLSGSGKNFKQILQGLADGTVSSATGLDLFGDKSNKVINMVKNGTIDIETMTVAVRDSEGAMEDTAEAAETFGDQWRRWWNGLLHGESVGGTWTWDSSDWTDIEEAAEGAAEVVEDEVVPATDAAREKFTEMAESADLSAESISQLTDYLVANVEGSYETANALSGISAEMAALDAETAAATESVSANLDGLMGRFNQTREGAAQSVEDTIFNLQTQMNYMDRYAMNMQKAAAMGVDEGLIAALADGSVESAEILDGIVQGSDEDIAALNETWVKTQEGRETFSENMGKIQTAFEEKSAALQEEYDAAVEHFNQYAANEANGAETVQGAIDGAKGMTVSLNATYKALGEGAAKSFKAGLDSVSTTETPGYAAGTDSAPAGLAWVGEQGPELMMLRGGETIFDHNESMALAREAMAASVRAQRRQAADVSATAARDAVVVAVDVKGIEDRLDGVIDAVENIEPVDLGAITGGVDRQLARSKKLVGMAGG
jgi:hypothetical protein